MAYVQGGPSGYRLGVDVRITEVVFQYEEHKNTTFVLMLTTPREQPNGPPCKCMHLSQYYHFISVESFNPRLKLFFNLSSSQKLFY